jgi:hypothetical protein
MWTPVESPLWITLIAIRNDLCLSQPVSPGSGRLVQDCGELANSVAL